MNHITRVLALVLVIIFACTSGLTACAPASEAVLAATQDPTPTATATPTPSPAPTPSLTMEQKAAMVWMGVDYQTCYAMEVYVFSGKVNGKTRLIWTTLEDKQINRTYSLYEPFSTTELCAYDLFNHEYLFTLKLPQNALQTDQMYLFRYITDVSPALSNSTFYISMNLLNLDFLYSIVGIYSAEIQDVGALIDSYIYIEPDAIGQWYKSRALEAYCAVTPEEYILPYWDYVPDTVMPENFYSTDASVSAPIPAVVYTQEQKYLMLDNKPDPNLLPIGSIEAFFCKVNGNKRIFWTVSYLNSDESNDDFKIHDYHSVFNNEYLFSLRFPIEELSTGIVTSLVWKYFYKSATQLEGMKLFGSSSILDLAKAYSEWGIPYDGNELIDSLATAWEKGDFSGLEMPITQDDITKLYIDTVPDAYLMPFWEYVPNAVTPDGFFTPVPESSPTTAP